MDRERRKSPAASSKSPRVPQQPSQRPKAAKVAAAQPEVRRRRLPDKDEAAVSAGSPVDSNSISNSTNSDGVSNSNCRPEADGESIPGTPPNEASPSSIATPAGVRPYVTDASEKEEDPPANPLKISVTVDLVVVVLLSLAGATRLPNLGLPRNVVFDEMHYGKYASMYLRGTFYFDANPPLGKMLIAAAGWLAGYDGQGFEFDKIGAAYPDAVPVASLRLIPAVCGCLLSPALYLLLTELGLPYWASGLAGFLLIMDTAFLAQSRFILLDSIMMIFALAAIISALKQRRYRSRPFGLGWWFWNVMTALNMGLAFSVKYLAFYSCCLCWWIVLQDFWQRLADRRVTNARLFLEGLVRWTLLWAVPLCVYLGVFWVHLSLLTRAGAHDNLMTSAFQASLEGGLSSIIKGQPLVVTHGSQVTLRHTHGRTCWLHSHEHVYPIRYPDGRGSSHQQQVSCYGYKDVNNWWIIKRPERNDLAVHEPLDPIRNGEVIQLVHGMTHRALNSHDVAAPMSPHCQEVTCYIDYNISMASENLWRVEIINGVEEEDQVTSDGSSRNNNEDGSGKQTRGGGGALWHSINSQVRLVHVSTNQALKYSGKVYPDWGYYQNEVVCDKQLNHLDAIWNVEEHRYTKSDEDKKSIEKEIFKAEMIPEAPTHMTFWEKLLELQITMLITNQENVQNHNYASDPTEWPFLTRGIAYFISKESNAQVHLMGNIIVWYSGSLSILVYCSLLVVYLLRRRRLCFDIPEDAWEEFANVGQVLLGGYLFHYLPFFFCDRTLFIHHYLTAYSFKIMLTSFLLHHFHRILRSRLSGRAIIKVLLFFPGLALWLGAVCYVFCLMSALAYGYQPLSADQVRSLRWKDTWDLIIHKP